MLTLEWQSLNTKRPENGLLFFEGKQHLTHFATEQDIADEFIALLSERETFIFKTSS